MPEPERLKEGRLVATFFTLAGAPKENMLESSGVLVLDRGGSIPPAAESMSGGADPGRSPGDSPGRVRFMDCAGGLAPHSMPPAAA